jgi:hypothetical protein
MVIWNIRSCYYVASEDVARRILTHFKSNLLLYRGKQSYLKTVAKTDVQTISYIMTDTAREICSALRMSEKEIALKENPEELLEASRDIDLEINAEKTKYMIMSRHPNSGQNQNIRIANESFEIVTKFKYLGTTLTNQNDIHDEIKK